VKEDIDVIGDIDIIEKVEMKENVNLNTKLEFSDGAKLKLKLFLENIKSEVLSNAIEKVENIDTKISYAEVANSICTFYVNNHFFPSNPDLILPPTEYHKECFMAIDKTAIQLEELADEIEGWDEKEPIKNVRIMTKDTGFYNQICVKGIGEVDATPQQIMEILTNRDTIGIWDDLCDGGEILEDIDEATKIVHMRFSTTYCILRQARDFIILRHLYEKENGNIILLGISAPNETYPPTEGYDRGEVRIAGFVAKPLEDDRSILIYASWSDLKGIEAKIGNFVDVKNSFISRIYEKQPLNIQKIRMLLAKKSTKKVGDYKTLNLQYPNIM